MITLKKFAPESVTAHATRSGKLRYGVAAWLLGLPLPIIIIALFIRGCDW